VCEGKEGKAARRKLECEWGERARALGQRGRTSTGGSGCDRGTKSTAGRQEGTKRGEKGDEGGEEGERARPAVERRTLTAHGAAGAHTGSSVKMSGDTDRRQERGSHAPGGGSPTATCRRAC